MGLVIRTTCEAIVVRIAEQSADVFNLIIDFIMVAYPPLQKGLQLCWSFLYWWAGRVKMNYSRSDGGTHSEGICGRFNLNICLYQSSIPTPAKRTPALLECHFYCKEIVIV